MRQPAPLDDGPGTPAAAIHHLFIGEHRVLDRIPVDPAFLAVGQPLFEEFEEHPLFMPVIVRRAGGQLAVPVIGKAHAAKLCPHGGDVLGGPVPGVNAALHGGIFRRKPERVPAHRMEDIEAAGTPVSGDDIAEGVVANMPHMDPSRRIGEHFQNVIFRLFRPGLGGKAVAVVPARLPFGLDGGCVVLIHSCHPDGTSVARRLFADFRD